MDCKKLLVSGLLSLFIISMMAGVLAEDKLEDEDVANSLNIAWSKVSEWSVKNMKFTDVAEGVDEYKGWLYAILLGMIIYTVISTFFADSSQFIKWGITVAVTAIAMIGIPSQIYSALEIQYGAMGSAILAAIPFFIVLFFTMKVGSLLIARLTWLFFILYSLAMSWARFFAADTGEAWPYVIFFIVGIMMIWFVGFFRATWFKGELDSQVEIAERQISRRKVARELDDENLTSQTGIKVVKKKS